MPPTHPTIMHPPVTASIRWGCSDSAPLTNWAIREATRPEPESTPKAVARTTGGKLSVVRASREFHPAVAHALNETARRTMICGARKHKHAPQYSGCPQVCTKAPRFAAYTQFDPRRIPFHALGAISRRGRGQQCSRMPRPWTTSMRQPPRSTRRMDARLPGRLALAYRPPPRTGSMPE